MSTISIFATVLLCFVSFVCHAEEQTVAPAAEPDHSYFLSVMVMERNQTSYLQEFVRHYLEEGVDHFFIYNSQNVPHLHAELACIDSKYYTIIPRLGNGTSNTPMRQSVFNIVQPQTKWLAMVDSDDYISSRAYPGKTIREILETGVHTTCEIISVPTLNFAWGDTKDTPVGNIRNTLTHRWGYDRHFSDRHKRPDGKKGSSKFADTFEKVRNRVIFQALKVRTVGTNSATLYKRGNMCISSVQATQACTHLPPTPPTSSVNTTSVSPSAVAAVPNGYPNDAAAQAASTVSPPLPLNALPKYCTEKNLYRAKRSVSYVHLLEQDIPGLTLACHHYRIPSWQEWQRRARLQPHLYKDSDIALANRQDVVDDHMQDRDIHRKYHVLQKVADTAMSACGKAPVIEKIPAVMVVQLAGQSAPAAGSVAVATGSTAAGGSAGNDRTSTSMRGSNSQGLAAAQDDAAGELGVEQESFITRLWSYIRGWLGM